MKTIIIDTTKESSFVYLVDDNSIDKTEISERNRLSELLLEKLDVLLKAHDLKLHDLDSVGVVNIPGSYTSMRIGITTANFISYSLCVPLFEIRKELREQDLLTLKKEKFMSPGSYLVPVYIADPVITSKSGRV